MIKKIPCGGFYVDDGAVQNVDGKPVLSAWNADLPKPSVGGYGYTEQGEQILFDGELLIDNPSSTPTGAVVSEINIDSLEVGETYNIVWNGVDYTCECMSVNLDGYEIAYLGNLSIMGLSISTDYPFVFAYEQDMYMVATLTAGTYSIKLSKSGGTIHKIDEKYLPDGGFGYTEPGEQTTITWDGDTEGRDSVLNAYFKVSDETPSESVISNGEIVFVNGVSGTVGGGAEVSDIAIMFADGTILLASSSGQVVTEDITFDIPSAGIYFMKESGVDMYITSLTYVTPDTVHKIDEKYLPVAQEKTGVIVTNIGDAWEFDAETIPQNLDDYSNINFIVYYLAPTAVGHDYIYAVIPCATCTYQFDVISSISGLPFVNGSTMIVPRIVYSENTDRYYGRVSEYALQDIIE